MQCQSHFSKYRFSRKLLFVTNSCLNTTIFQIYLLADERIYERITVYYDEKIAIKTAAKYEPQTL